MFNEVTPKRSLQKYFNRLNEYEKGYIQHLRDSFIIDQKLDSSKKEYSQKVLISYSSDCVNTNMVLGYLASYFDIFGYKVSFHIIRSYSREIMNITIHKTARSKDIDLIDYSPLDIIKLEEERNKKYDDEEKETIHNPHIMTANEARDIADEKNKEKQLSVDSYLLRIGEAIGKASKEGKYSVDFNLEYEVDTEVVNKLSSYLESLGFTVNENTAWNSTDGYYKKLTIEFYSK